MGEYRLVRNKTRSKKKLLCATTAAFITVLMLFGAFYLWINAGEKRLIWESTYRVLVPEDPAVSGRLYETRNGWHLLVLTSPSSEHQEAYYINLDSHQIGSPSFSKSRYIPLRRSALVDYQTLQGYPYYGTIEAEWKMGSDGQEVRIHIKGYDTNPAMHVDPSLDDPNEIVRLSRKRMPIGCQREIVLTK